MEIATIITSFEEAISLFDKFIYSYSGLRLINKDNDTAYFAKVTDEKEKFYYHYKLNSPEIEFSYNYSNKEISEIKEHYGGKSFLMFDLSFQSEQLLTEILTSFKTYVIACNEKLLSDILISHPFNKLKKLKQDY